MTYISSHQILPPYPFRLSGLILEYTANQRDLGVLLNFNLDFALHYSAIIRKANVAAYNILKCFNTLRPLTMVKAFVIYVRPLLETFSQVWNPVRKGDIKRLEGVQRRFTRNVYKKCDIPSASYETRLEFLNMETLNQRRKHLDLALTHRLFHTGSQVATQLINRTHCSRELRNTHHHYSKNVMSRNVILGTTILATESFKTGTTSHTIRFT